MITAAECNNITQAGDSEEQLVFTYNVTKLTATFNKRPRPQMPIHTQSHMQCIHIPICNRDRVTEYSYMGKEWIIWYASVVKHVATRQRKTGSFLLEKYMPRMRYTGCGRKK